jgi:hypothetical protein
VRSGIQLFLLSEDTDRFFAWTINSPLTAAFLGACDRVSVPLAALSSRLEMWAHARIGFPAVLTLLVVLPGVTLSHLDRFHMDSYTGWTWLAVYTLVPPIMTEGVVVHGVPRQRARVRAVRVAAVRIGALQ